MAPHGRPHVRLDETVVPPQQTHFYHFRRGIATYIEGTRQRGIQGTQHLHWQTINLRLEIDFCGGDANKVYVFIMSMVSLYRLYA